MARGKFENLTGRIFCRLTVLHRTDDYIFPSGNRISRWMCKCECGNEVVVLSRSLISGHTKSCGCLGHEKNKYIDNGDCYIGVCSNEDTFIIDKSSFELVYRIRWHKDKNGYIVGTDRLKGKLVYMHRHLIDPDSDCYVDHINGNRTDNRMSNLRVVDSTHNSMNRSLQSNNKSGCHGVCFCASRNKWQASIWIHKKRTYLGSFEEYDDAMAARIEAEDKYFGEYSYRKSRLSGGIL